MNSPKAPATLSALRRLVGLTPLIEVECEFRGRTHRIYGKFEALNFTGSIKDRMALTILEQAYASGEIEPGDEIAEATSGNTGIAFAAMGRALGSIEFSKFLLQEAKVAVSPGIGFGEYGDEYVRFALIENEHRTRQAVRGIRKALGGSDAGA